MLNLLLEKNAKIKNFTCCTHNGLCKPQKIKRFGLLISLECKYFAWIYIAIFTENIIYAMMFFEILKFFRIFVTIKNVSITISFNKQNTLNKLNK